MSASIEVFLAFLRLAIARQYRGAERPSDHVPVTATLEV